jgi:hypothetical protein
MQVSCIERAAVGKGKGALRICYSQKVSSKMSPA